MPSALFKPTVQETIKIQTAACDLPVYISSYDHNSKPDQLPWGGNGGDDINNWDSASGWSESD